MIAIDLSSLLWGAAGTVFLFLFGWAGKHTLDRLLLPRLLDWWATQTRTRALKRAQGLVDNFEYEVACYADIRMLLYRTDRHLRQTIFVFLVFSIICVVALLKADRTNVLINSTNPIHNFPVLPEFLIRIGILLLLCVNFGLLWSLVGRPTLSREMIKSPKAVAARTLRRIDRLLVAAGLTDVEQLNWRAENARNLIRIATPTPPQTVPSGD
jgi:hypothetical protein